MSKTYLVNEADLTAIANAIRAKSGTTEPLTFSSEMVNVIETLSTGVELNFDVVGGTTQPTSPKENTIWINTDVEIAEWVFGENEPIVPTEGMLWIRTGNTLLSNIVINAIKQNAIQMVIVSADQYINGVWVDKSGCVYQNGEWVDFGVALFIYEHGLIDGYTFTIRDDLDDKQAKITHQDDRMTVTAGADSYVLFRTSSKISIKKEYKTLKMELQNASMKIDSKRCWFGLSSGTSVDGSNMSIKTTYAAFSGNNVLSVDVSSVEASMYVALHLGTPVSDGRFSADITKIWFE